MYLTHARCIGEVRLSGARIGGGLGLNCTRATFMNAEGVSLNVDRLIVQGDMYLTYAQSAGEIRMVRARIGGILTLLGITCRNSGRPALTANRARCRQRHVLRSSTVRRRRRLTGIHVSQIEFTGAVLNNVGGRAVDLERASVVHAVLMRPASFSGSLNLSHARVGRWYDEKRTWSTDIQLDGFTYDRIDGLDLTVKERLQYWLPGSAYLPQPYEQLASVYRREGNETDARVVMIGKQRARRADVRASAVAERGVERSVAMDHRLRYRPTLSLIPLVSLMLTGSLLFLLASQHPDPLHPMLRLAKPGSPEQPAFNSFRYTMDLLLPVVNFKQRDAFVAEGWAAWAAFGFTFVGWLLAAIVVAGLTGVFKRD